jgi:hypothetical protein
MMRTSSQTNCRTSTSPNKRSRQLLRQAWQGGLRSQIIKPAAARAGLDDDQPHRLNRHNGYQNPRSGFLFREMAGPVLPPHRCARSCRINRPSDKSGPPGVCWERVDGHALGKMRDFPPPCPPPSLCRRRPTCHSPMRRENFSISDRYRRLQGTLSYKTICAAGTMAKRAAWQAVSMSKSTVRHCPMQACRSVPAGPPMRPSPARVVRSGDAPTWVR